LVAQIITQHSLVQSKNIEFTALREGLNDMQQWIVENLDAPFKFPYISD